MPTDADLEAALERVISLARDHLMTVRSRTGVNDEAVWEAFVALNNASADYDALLLEAYDEVTPWDVELIGPEPDDDLLDVEPDLEVIDADQGGVISVRARYDFAVPTVAALLEAGQRARVAVWEEADGPVDRVQHVGEAVYELLHAGGVFPALLVPELTPGNGVVLVHATSQPLTAADLRDEDSGPDVLLLTYPHDEMLFRLDEIVLDD